MLIREVATGDREKLFAILNSTAVFAPDEIEAAMMQIDHSLASTGAADYNVFVAEEDGAAAGFLSVGPTPRHPGVFDLYWLAVDPPAQRRGIGRSLVRFAESWSRERGGNTLLIETWNSRSFAATRRFYVQCGYDEVTRVKDFRRLQHDKIIYSKALN